MVIGGRALLEITSPYQNCILQVIPLHSMLSNHLLRKLPCAERIKRNKSQEQPPALLDSSQGSGIDKM